MCVDSTWHPLFHPVAKLQRQDREAAFVMTFTLKDVPIFNALVIWVLHCCDTGFTMCQDRSLTSVSKQRCPHWSPSSQCPKSAGPEDMKISCCLLTPHGRFWDLERKDPKPVGWRGKSSGIWRCDAFESRRQWLIPPNWEESQNDQEKPLKWKKIQDKHLSTADPISELRTPTILLAKPPGTRSSKGSLSSTSYLVCCVLASLYLEEKSYLVVGLRLTTYTVSPTGVQKTFQGNCQ